MASKREAKRQVCSDVAAELRASIERGHTPQTDDGVRYADAARDLVEELERRGASPYRAPRPTADAPALPLEHPDFTDTETSTDG